MEIDKIREQLARELENNLECWNAVLSNTSPGNYGCNSWEVQISADDIFVDIPKRTFNVKSGFFTAQIILGASKGEYSFETEYSKPFTAVGKFDFENKSQVRIKDVNIRINPDIFGDD